MRATEFITELFQSGKNWEWVNRSNDNATAQFTVGKINYVWYAFTYQKDNPTRWEVMFRITDKNKVKGKTLYDVTGSGNSAEVMSTVVDITRSFLEEYKDKVTQLTFDSKGDSRTGLYLRMVKRLLPNWELTTRQGNEGTEFILSKP